MLTMALTVAVGACGGSSSAPSGAGTATTATAPSGPTVVINNFHFVPASVTVAAGATVTWVNRDLAVHDIKLSGGALSPLLMPNSAKDSWSHTFPKAGTYSYICGIHPFMAGTVTVTG